jgi:hypothetical protein
MKLEGATYGARGSVRLTKIGEMAMIFPNQRQVMPIAAAVSRGADRAKKPALALVNFSYWSEKHCPNRR